MKCLRCGYCCTHMAVMVVIDPAKPPTEDNVECHNLDGKSSPCRHLQGDKPGEYSCAVHNEEWYVDTPCYSHNRDVSKCYIGHFMLAKQHKPVQECTCPGRREKFTDTIRDPNRHLDRNCPVHGEEADPKTWQQVCPPR